MMTAPAPKPTVHLAHGINTFDNGRATTDKLVVPFRRRGFATRQWDYGWRGVLGARLGNPGVAAQIVKAVRPGDIGCGFSNGGAIHADAADLGAPYEGLVLINAALKSDRVFAPQLKWIHVYCNAGDYPVLAAELLDWLPWYWKTPHFMGRMGNVGYTGSDPRVTTFRCPPLTPHLDGHSAIFAKGQAVWRDRIAENAQAAHYAASFAGDGLC